MDSLQILIMIICIGYIVSFITYLINREYGLRMRDSLNMFILFLLFYFTACMYA